jgi:hypothetical protein
MPIMAHLPGRSPQLHAVDAGIVEAEDIVLGVVLPHAPRLGLGRCGVGRLNDRLMREPFDNNDAIAFVGGVRTHVLFLSLLKPRPSRPLVAVRPPARKSAGVKSPWAFQP